MTQIGDQVIKLNLDPQWSLSIIKGFETGILPLVVLVIAAGNGNKFFRKSISEFLKANGHLQREWHGGDHPFFIWGEFHMKAYCLFKYMCLRDHLKRKKFVAQYCLNGKALKDAARNYDNLRFTCNRCFGMQELSKQEKVLKA